MYHRLPDHVDATTDSHGPGHPNQTAASHTYMYQVQAELADLANRPLTDAEYQQVWELAQDSEHYLAERYPATIHRSRSRNSEP